MNGSEDDIDRLRQVGPIKTWSLLVTVFGDLRAGPDRPLSGGALRSLFAEMGVKPEALRVALHRLAKDGWIQSEKTGRTSVYSLTPKSLAETEAVRARVYDAEVPALETWRFIALRDALPTGPHVTLGPQLYAEPASARPDTEALLLSPTAPPPEWLAALCLDGDMGVRSDALLAAIGTIGGAEDPLRRAAIRMLILHQWRRLALRDGLWLHMALWPDGAPRRCRTAVHLALATYPADGF